MLAQIQLPGGGSVTAPDGVPTVTSDGTAISSIISLTVNILGVVGALAALLFLIWGGIKWITSGGDREKLESARRTVIFAIIGLVVIILSYVVINLVGGVLGINTI